MTLILSVFIRMAISAVLLVLAPCCSVSLVAADTSSNGGTRYQNQVNAVLRLLLSLILRYLKIVNDKLINLTCMKSVYSVACMDITSLPLHPGKGL